jgi:exodeoxyribonuclease VII small subunit
MNNTPMTRNTSDASAAPDFETSLQELEALVERLERGDLPLAESLALFEQGVALTRSCHTRLSEAQQKVSILLQQNAAPQDFDPDADEHD